MTFLILFVEFSENILMKFGIEFFEFIADMTDSSFRGETLALFEAFVVFVGMFTKTIFYPVSTSKYISLNSEIRL